MNGKNRSRPAPALLVSLVLAAVVVACGGGSVPSPSAQGKKVTPAPPSAGTKYAKP